jgi:hypothetical protein
MFSTKRKGLTGRPARDQFNGTIQRSEVKFPDIALREGPVSYRIKAPMLVVPDGIASPPIPIYDRYRIKTGLAHANRHAARAHEELNGAH